MKLTTGMVISSVKAPNTYNEITRLYVENGKKMAEISQFSVDEEDKTITFLEREILYMLRKRTAYVVNNWASRN